jgi:lysophospholipase L1-like esterase
LSPSPASPPRETDSDARLSFWRKALFALASTLLFAFAVEGCARLLWWRLEDRALGQVRRHGEAVLRNDAINFMKQPHAVYGYVLKPGFARGGAVINSQGFAQRETVPITRVPGKLRVVAMGESTTQGHDVDTANYPAHLRRRLAASTGRILDQVEMLNAGVSGWVSDQVALRAEHEAAAYRPDIVVLYVGWNDFQAYDPYRPPAQLSYFDIFYAGGLVRENAAIRFKTVALATAAYQRLAASQRVAACLSGASSKAAAREPPERVYRFFVRSLDRIVAAFRTTNPNVRVALSTLVGRWPHGSRSDLESDQGRTWWMRIHDCSPQTGADDLHRFNDLIRAYVRERNLTLVDEAAVFDPLDRGAIMWDFAHMNGEGYELLAEVMYEALRSSHIVDGEPSSRRRDLQHKYAGGT